MRFCIRTHMKKLLSIIITVSLLASSAFAAPGMVSVVESVQEVQQDADVLQQEPENIVEKESSEMQEEKEVIPGPALNAVVTDIEEVSGGNEKPSNHSQGDATLFFASFTAGDGSKESPYIISNAQEIN